MEKRTIKIESREHRGKKCVFLNIGHEKELHDAARSLTGRNWSNTHKSWYVEERKGLRAEIIELFKGKGWVDCTGFNELADRLPIIVSPKKPQLQKLGELNAAKKDRVEQFRRWMLSKRYSGSTIDTYTDALVVFLRFFFRKRNQRYQQRGSYLFQQ